MAVAKGIQGSGPEKEPVRADTLSGQRLLNFGVAGEDGAVDENDTSLKWEDIKWLRSITRMQIWLKGVLTEEDIMAWTVFLISNHGGRQLDSATSTLDALPECVATAKGRIPIHVDGVLGGVVINSKHWH